MNTHLILDLATCVQHVQLVQDAHPPIRTSTFSDSISR